MSSPTTLFTPLQIGDLTISNRIGMSALTRNRAANGGVPTELMAEYYAQRAAGGAGLIISEGTLITPQGTEWPDAPGMWVREQVEGWKKVTDAVHRKGGYIYSQLWHVGRLARPEGGPGKPDFPVYAPSAIPARGGKYRHLPDQPGHGTPTAIDDPWTVVKEYRKAAYKAKAAGFDGVELHASGSLIAQFLDASSNQRTDQWGGSVENRARFGLEVLKQLIAMFGRNVSLKVSPTGGYGDLGMPLEENIETYRYFLSEADKLNLSYITLRRYSPLLDAEFDGKKRATVHDVLESYRPCIKHAKVFLNANVTAEEGAKLVADGSVDGIFIGFSWITHPDLAKRIQHGKPLDNIPDIPHLQKGGAQGYTNYPTAVY